MRKHLKILGVVIARAFASLKVCAKLKPCIGDCVTPRICVGGSTPSASSTVGTISMAWAY
jgi:hypothetical protein